MHHANVMDKYFDDGASRRERGTPEIQDETVVFESVEGYGYHLSPIVQTAGTYYLTVVERGQADIIFPYSWDYRPTATLEK